MAKALTKSKADQMMSEIKKYKERTSKLREKAKESAERTVESAATIGGGALGGYIHAEYGDKEYFGVEAQTVAGAVATIVGIMDLAGKQSSMVGALGEGILAYDLGRRVAEKLAGTAGVSGMSNAKLREMMRVANKA